MEKKSLHETKHLFWTEMTNKIYLYRAVLIEVIFDALNQTEEVWHVFFQGIFKEFQFVTCTCYYHIFHN